MGSVAREMTVPYNKKQVMNDFKGFDITYFANTVKWVIAMVVATWLTIPSAIQLLLVFMFLDFLSGLLAAGMEGKLNSHDGFNGLARKVLTLVLVTGAHYLSQPLGVPFDIGSAVANAYTVNEMISILENCSTAGVWVPVWLLSVLAKAKSAINTGTMNTITTTTRTNTTTDTDSVTKIKVE